MHLHVVSLQFHIDDIRDIWFIYAFFYWRLFVGLIFNIYIHKVLKSSSSGVLITYTVDGSWRFSFSPSFPIHGNFA